MISTKTMSAIYYRLGDTDREEKTERLKDTERRLRQTCEQIILLNNQIRALTKRYNAAKAEGFGSFRYNLRVRLAAVEGVRNVFYEYARDRAEDVADLRRDLYNQNVTIVTDSDDSDAEY